jgi:trehalose 6-phosphate synthase
VTQERSAPDDGGSLADTVIVAGTVGGGLAGSLHPLLTGTGATWVACALSEADRAAAAAGMMTVDGLDIELVDPDAELYNMAYNVVSNATLWYLHHHLFDSTRRPRADRRWWEAWDAYRELNGLFAHAVAKVAPERGRVLVQDYHLALTGSELARLRPDLRTVHFTHTPFADASILRMLPTSVGDELLNGMAAFDACGFHTARWADAYRQALSYAKPSGEARGPGSVFVSPLSTDSARLRASADDPAVADALALLEERIGGPDRQVIVRVDRMELSKNLLRGFWAFEEMLENEPQRRERVVMVALAYPTRQKLADYLAYHNEVESTVDRINRRWSTPGWTPIVLDVEDDYPRSLAALRRYDVLLVNPVRDGLNLVAKEGPLINDRHGVLALSREAGAFEELQGAALEINPFDVSGTAGVLSAALDMEDGERTGRAADLANRVLARQPRDWLQDQLDAAG